LCVSFFTPNRVFLFSLYPHAQAGELALKHGASACTDVTGFGLLGHLVEMCNASAVEAAARTATTIGGGSGGGGEGVSGGGGGVNDRVSGVGALLKLEAIPLLEGAEECVKNKVFSSLHPQNLRLRRAVSLPAATDPNLAHRPAFSLLFDPQTSGGLLVSVPAAGAADFVQALRVSGYGDAAVIGEVVPPLAVDEPSSPVCVGFL
jgi:selenide,water dikinase